METKVQKLGKRNTYTPIDASQVYSPVVVSLNKEETLSEHDLKTSHNNLDVNLLSGKTEHNLRVYVINMRGKPLMPTSPAKARHLIQNNKAKVVSCKPFTIQLTIATGETKQEIKLGIDSDARFIGYSATTKTKELISGELELRTDVSKKISDRAMYRKTRRGKLWYRQVRFLNRVSSKKKGWLAPSIQHKLNTHIRLVNKIKELLPITETIVEVAQFDAQKLQNVDISGVEYQQGQMQGYDNLRAFVLARDSYTCQICKQKEGVFNIHHVVQRKDGGSDRPDNLVTVHVGCHKKFHSGKIKHKFVKPKSFKETAIMNNVWSRVVDVIGAKITFGYVTKRKRLNLSLEKTHNNDAYVISGGEKQERCIVSQHKQIRRNNRKLQQNRKGYKPAIRRQRYRIQSGDLISYKHKKFISGGTFNLGRYVVFVKNNYGIKYAKINDIEVINYGKGLQI